MSPSLTSSPNEWEILEPNELRIYLDEQLPTIAEFDAFCIDRYYRVYRQFSLGMTREQKTTILIDHILQRKATLPQKGLRKIWLQVKRKITIIIVIDWVRRTINGLSREDSSGTPPGGHFFPAIGITIGGGVTVIVGALLIAHHRNGSPPPAGRSSGVETLAAASSPLVRLDNRSSIVVADLGIEPLAQISQISHKSKYDNRTTSKSKKRSMVNGEENKPIAGSATRSPRPTTEEEDELQSEQTDDTAQEAKPISRTPPPAWIPMVLIRQAGNAQTPGHAYWLMKTEVTQSQFSQIYNRNPSHFRGDDLPVETVSWLDAVKFCNDLSMHERLPVCYEIKGDRVRWLHGLQCSGYRLATQDEWLYAARAGNAPGATQNDRTPLGWYFENAGYRTHPVGRKQANTLTLHDMIGNVAEWLWCAEHTSIISLNEAPRCSVIGGSYYDSDRRLNGHRITMEPVQYRSSQIGIRLARSAP